MNNDCKAGNTEDLTGRVQRQHSLGGKILFGGTIIVVGLVGKYLYDQAVQTNLLNDFHHTPEYIQLEKQYDAKRAEIDAPYFKQRHELDSIYQLKLNELRQIFDNSKDKYNQNK